MSFVQEVGLIGDITDEQISKEIKKEISALLLIGKEHPKKQNYTGWMLKCF